MRGLWRLALAASLLGAAAAAWAAPVVRTASGRVAGISRDGVNAFLGIPFAAAPVGTLRWRPPQPASPWQGVRPATAFGHSCWQSLAPEGFGPWSHEYVTQGDISEDCLYLNVWAPAHATGRLPVLIWIYGGGFNSGSSAIPIYDGRALARRGIVVVNLNYRVGPFGFLAHPDLTREAAGGANANFGLQDMIAALRWVRANIAAFHGDPDAVTIAGQSAGAMAVHALIASPTAQGLFARGIAESGLPDTARLPDRAAAEADGVAFAQAKGAATIAALRALPADALIPRDGANPLRFGPMRDGVLLPGLAPVRPVPLLTGFTVDEAVNNATYGSADPAALRDLIDGGFGASGARLAPLYPAASDAERSESNRQVRRDRTAGALLGWATAQRAAPIWAYWWTHPEPGAQAARWRAFHSSEIPYVFQTFDASPERGFGAADHAVSHVISSYWLNFVKTGDPNGAGLPRWPRFDPAKPTVMAIGEDSRAVPLLPPEKLVAMKAYLSADNAPR